MKSCEPSEKFKIRRLLYQIPGYGAASNPAIICFLVPPHGIYTSQQTVPIVCINDEQWNEKAKTQQYIHAGNLQDKIFVLRENVELAEKQVKVFIEVRDGVRCTLTPEVHWQANLSVILGNPRVIR